MSEMTNLKVIIELYKYVVLSSTLYGCEVWNSLKVKEILVAILNRLQHCIIKRILKVKTSTRSDMCECIREFISSRHFPPKFAWKKTSV